MVHISINILSRYNENLESASKFTWKNFRIYSNQLNYKKKMSMENKIKVLKTLLE